MGYNDLDEATVKAYLREELEKYPRAYLDGNVPNPLCLLLEAAEEFDAYDKSKPVPEDLPVHLYDWVNQICADYTASHPGVPRAGARGSYAGQAPRPRQL